MERNAGEDLDPKLKAQAEEVHAAMFRELEPKLMRLFFADGFPSTLCHYTNFAGLQGILETGSLWATYGLVLNDATEYKYGKGLLAPYVEARLPKELLEYITGPIERPLRNFVTCFCERNDVLSMWHSYAASGGGFCLEFDGSLLGCSFPPHSFCAPMKMLYGTTLSQHMKDILDFLCSFGSQGQLEAVTAGNWLTLFALKFKHPAFHQESEWRIVIRGPEVGQMKFRCGYADVKPYIELCPVMKDGTKRLPLRRVVFGPTLRNDETLIEIIGLMLERYGYVGIPVESSGIPYRL